MPFCRLRPFFLCRLVHRSPSTPVDNFTGSVYGAPPGPRAAPRRRSVLSARPSARPSARSRPVGPVAERPVSPARPGTATASRPPPRNPRPRHPSAPWAAAGRRAGTNPGSARARHERRSPISTSPTRRSCTWPSESIWKQYCPMPSPVGRDSIRIMFDAARGVLVQHLQQRARLVPAQPEDHRGLVGARRRRRAPGRPQQHEPGRRVLRVVDVGDQRLQTVGRGGELPPANAASYRPSCTSRAPSALEAADSHTASGSCAASQLRTCGWATG